MESWIFLTDVLILLAGAFIFGIAAQFLRQSAIIGYLLAGAIFGPFLFHPDPLMHVAEMGVALLLFTIGLEFSFTRLRRLGSIALGGGCLQIGSTMFITALVLGFFVNFSTALALGAMIALSSTAVVLRILVDRTEIDSPRGRNALGILLLQDIAVVPLVLMVTMMGQASGGFHDIGLQILKVLFGAAALVVLFYVLFYLIVPRFLFSGTIQRNRDLVVLLAIISAIGSSWLAHELGLSPALGAFIAGMMLAESPFAAQIRADIGSIRTLFVTLFFATIGLLLDPQWLLYNLHWVLVGLVVVVLVKTVLIYGIARFFRRPPVEALATGITLAQVGEFSFVLATASRDLALITQEIFSLIVSVTIVSIFISTYMVNMAPALARGLLGKKKRSEYQPLQETAADTGRSDRILVVGFGPAGRRVADALIEHNIRPEIIEMNPVTAMMARNRGLSAHIGDALNEEVLEHAGINNACLVVITIPDPRMVIFLIGLVKRLAERAVVVARCRYNMYRTDMESAGAEVVADEENMVGMHLAEAAIATLKEANSEEMACALGISGV